LTFFAAKTSILASAGFFIISFADILDSFLSTDEEEVKGLLNEAMAWYNLMVLLKASLCSGALMQQSPTKSVKQLKPKMTLFTPSGICSTSVDA
jgi:hypothetical protein